MTAVRRCIASTALAAGQSSSAVKALLALATLAVKSWLEHRQTALLAEGQTEETPADEH